MSLSAYFKKRLYVSVKKKMAALTWTDGFAVRRYAGLLWLLNHRNYVDRHIGLLGGFETRQLDYLREHSARGTFDAFLDIGANFGLYSLFAVSNGLARECLCFEPDTRNYAQLQANLYLNAMTDSLTVHQLAVSDASGNIGFSKADDHFTGCSRIDRDSGATVKAVALDDLLDWTGRRLLFKIDIEGYETAAIAGATRLLGNNRCLLQIESFPDNFAQLDAAMRALGYRKIHQIDEDHYYTNESGS